MIISNKSGVATLPTVLVLSIMALAVVVSITAMAFNELLISQGAAQSSTALFYAEAGARDALTRIARNKSYTCSAADCYSVDFVTNGCSNGTDCAKVSVSSGVGSSADPKIIISSGIMNASKHKMQITVTLDSGTTVAANQTGAITGAVWTELMN